jgi:thermostable 8-oxoguanine DNA glycosylase
MRETEDLGEQTRSSITESTDSNAFTVDEICSIIADDLDTINAVGRRYPVEHIKVYLRGKKIAFDTGKYNISTALTKITITQILNDIDGLSVKEAKDYLKNVAKDIYRHNSYTKEMIRIWSRPSYWDNRL